MIYPCKGVLCPTDTSSTSTLGNCRVENFINDIKSSRCIIELHVIHIGMQIVRVLPVGDHSSTTNSRLDLQSPS